LLLEDRSDAAPQQGGKLRKRKEASRISAAYSALRLYL
jgi:hypothetical protein